MHYSLGFICSGYTTILGCAFHGCVGIVASQNCGEPLTLKATSLPIGDILSPLSAHSIKAQAEGDNGQDVMRRYGA
jgi:hypothetical protein